MPREEVERLLSPESPSVQYVANRYGVAPAELEEKLGQGGVLATLIHRDHQAGLPTDLVEELGSLERTGRLPKPTRPA